jgi:hypothetical protein
MSDPVNGPEAPGSEEEDGKIPVMQSIMDNPFLILFLGVAIPTVLYTLWGVMEIAQIPIAR